MKCMYMEVEGARCNVKREAKKDLVGSDMKGLGLASVVALDRRKIVRDSADPGLPIASLRFFPG